MTKEQEKQLIETIDDEGKIVKFELFDILEYEGKEYALLIPQLEGIEPEEDNEVVLMKLSKDGEDYLFEVIEDDEEFNKVSEYIENMDVENE